MIFSNFMSYSSYENIHKVLSYPVIRFKFYLANGYWPNLSNPKTFNECIIFDKLNQRNNLLPLITDKELVRGYVKSKVGDSILIPMHAVYKDENEIVNEIFSANTIYKATHASGLNFIVRNVTDINLDESVLQLRSWFKKSYKNQLLLWFTNNMERKIIAEKLLLDVAGKVPYDYKFFVVDSKVLFIQVDQDRFESHTRNLYTPDWELMSVEYRKPNGSIIDRPENLEQMLLVAEKLAEDFKFMRVDLYELNGDIYFGELTPYPSSGNARFEPNDLDIEIGKLLNV